jgi:ABC-type sugar transport system permease subunit
MQAEKHNVRHHVSWLDSMRAYLYIAPALIIYALFFLWPLLHLIQLSSIKWTGVGPRIFVGLENYVRILTSDAKFWLAFEHNLMWLMAAVVVPITVGLFLAILLARTRLHGRLLFRTVYFLPQVLSSVVVAVIWRGMYNPNYGAINSILRGIGLDALAHGWLGDRATALPALFIAWSWIHYGFCMVIFIAALQGIEEVYFDAAKVDGANALEQIWYVALPFIRRPLATVILLTAIAAFQVFDLVFITTKGGPAGATLVLSVHMYDNAFRYDKVGEGAALAVLLGVLISLMSVVFLSLRRRLEAD